MTPSPRRRRSHRAAAAVLTATLLLPACGGGEEPVAIPTATARPRPSPTRTPSPTPSQTGPIAPLTGQVVTQDNGDLDRPVLAVKVENSAAARPQSGLDQADVVYEELVEGGVTRFIVLFHSQVPDAIGPIRSGRLVDVDVLPAYKPLMALSGARDEVMSALAGAGIALMADGQGFYREPSRSAPHDLYSSGAALWERGESLSRAEPARAWWEFDTAVPDTYVDCAGDPVCEDAGRSVAFSMSQIYTTGWEYDEDAGLYRRLQNGVPFLAAGKGRIGAANVVLMAMPVGAGACCDTSGARLVRTDVLGEGRAVILRDGHWYEAKWRKPSRSAPLQLLDEDGKPFVFKPGPTWLHLAPKQNVPLSPAGG